MVWTLNNTVVLTISREYGVLPSIDPNVMAEKVPSSKVDSWVFILKNTERLHEGPVACDIQDFERKTANLFVQGLFIHMCVCVYICLCVWEWVWRETMCMCVWLLPWFIVAGRQQGTVCFFCREIQWLFVPPASLRDTHFIYTHLHTHTSSKGKQADGKSHENYWSVRGCRNTLNLTLTWQKAVCKKRQMKRLNKSCVAALILPTHTLPSQLKNTDTQRRDKNKQTCSTFSQHSRCTS